MKNNFEVVLRECEDMYYTIANIVTDFRIP
jgi:hypothetical protein